MPNWIMNRVRVYGKPERIAKVKQALRTFDDSELHELEDKLAGKIPMEEYELEENLRKKLEHLKAKDKSYFTNVFDFNAVIPMPPHSETFFAKGCLGNEDRLKYGKNNWYDWSIKNWGTKWNSCETRLEDEEEDFLEYTFNTAWAEPVPVIAELARKFGVKVICDYYDADDFPNAAGRLKAEPGTDMKETRHSEDLEWLAEEFGSNLLESYGYELVNGKWEYVEQ